MTEHDQLPLPDYDHLPLGSLASRIRSLDQAGVENLLEYERAHGNRAPVVTVLGNRLAALRSGAQPSDGDPSEVAPEAPPPPAGGSKVSESTSGPPMNPPSHGDPTNPTQPRSTG
jgi:hypothetical protein